MYDPKVLKACGTTNERLKEIFTATKPMDGGDPKVDREIKDSSPDDYDLAYHFLQRLAVSFFANG